MKAALEGDSQTPVLSGVFETFRTSVMEYYEKKYPGSEAVRTGVRNLLEGLEARCVKQMNWAGMEWWRGKTQEFLLWFPALMGGAVLVAGLGTAELICLSLMIGIMGCCLAVMTFYISRCIKYQR